MKRDSRFLVWIAILIVAPVIFIVKGYKSNSMFGILLLIAYFAFGIYYGRPMFFGFMGNMTYIRGRKEKSKLWFKRAYDTKKVKPSVMISYAFLLLVTSDLHEANRVVDEILEKKLNKDEEILARSNKAFVLWKLGKLDASVNTMQQLYEKTKNANLYGTYGFLLNQSNNFERALKFNLEAYEFDKKNPVIMENLAETYLNLGRFNKAEEIFEEVLKRELNFSEPSYYYGILLMKREKFEKALDNMKKAYDSDIPFLSVLTKEKIQEKIDELNKCIEKNKNLLVAPDIIGE